MLVSLVIVFIRILEWILHSQRILLRRQVRTNHSKMDGWFTHNRQRRHPSHVECLRVWIFQVRTNRNSTLYHRNAIGSFPSKTHHRRHHHVLGSDYPSSREKRIQQVCLLLYLVIGILQILLICWFIVGEAIRHLVTHLATVSFHSSSFPNLFINLQTLLKHRKQKHATNKSNH